MPPISVLMPVYNAEKYLDESIGSILNQTFTDFEFLILDDASQDNSYAVMEKYANQDKRIKIFKNKKNIKEAECRNFLMKKSTADFIAWMDADDFSLPNRLKLQYNFLKKYANIDILGGQAAIHRFDLNSRPDWYANNATTNRLIKSQMIVISPLTSPSCMIRIKKIKKYNIYYNPYYQFAPDYKFWVDCLPYCQFANLDKTIIKYRLHQKQVSQLHSKKQEIYHAQIIQSHLKKFNIHLKEDFLIDFVDFLNDKDKNINHSILLDIKKQFFDPIIKIKNFYGYSCFHKIVHRVEMLKFFYTKFYIKLGFSQGTFFFIQDYKITNFIYIFLLTLAKKIGLKTIL